MVENLSPKQTWDALRADPDAQLVDVRTDAEWQYVGIPDLRPAHKQAVLVSWQYFPSGNVNPEFVSELRDALERIQQRLPDCKEIKAWTLKSLLSKSKQNV